MLFAATNSALAFEDAPAGINMVKLLSVQLEPPEVSLPTSTPRTTTERAAKAT